MFLHPAIILFLNFLFYYFKFYFMLYWIDGQFWSWKTAMSVYISHKLAIRTAKILAKHLSWWTIILSNIKMDKEHIPNYFYFDDDKFLEILRSVNLVNDLERILYWKNVSKWWITKWERKKFTNFVLFFDESWAIMNNKKKVDNVETYVEYINQNRKNFEDIYLVSAKWAENFKSLRSKVDWWYYVKPLSKIPILRDIWLIYREQREEDWLTPLMEKFVWKDENWDFIVKERPINEFVDWFWKPNVWRLYDDLHKNIRDPEKYDTIDYWLVKEILEYKVELQEPIKELPQFSWLKNLLPNDKKNVNIFSNTSLSDKDN